MSVCVSRSDGNSENEIEPDWFLTIRDTSPAVQLNNDVSLPILPSLSLSLFDSWLFSSTGGFGCGGGTLWSGLWSDTSLGVVGNALSFLLCFVGLARGA